MAERPIIFSAPMVRAILAGRKTQTRRVLKPQPVADASWAGGWRVDSKKVSVSVQSFNERGGRCLPGDSSPCPYTVGDTLWVREAWALVPRTAYRCSEGVQQTLRPNDDHDAAIYRASFDRSSGGCRWRPSIHMPRWASRITLRVTNVRVERLHDISEEDARAEGAERMYMDDDGKFYQHHTGTYRTGFAGIWAHIHGPGGWAANPWVVAVSFEVQP